MARTKIDLNRFKKTYPRNKKSPLYFSQATDVKSFKISFTSSAEEELAIGEFITHPIVVLGGEDNVNLWISNLVKTNSIWYVTVKSSAIHTGDVHVHAHEPT